MAPSPRIETKMRESVPAILPEISENESLPNSLCPCKVALGIVCRSVTRKLQS